ncbi:MAG: TM2 domain-containing protein [Fusobacteria bacterium]|nr:TM2 domain-containing protein [Fusobacteriota bacterium]
MHEINICKKDLDSVDGILKNLDKIKDKFEVKKALLKALSLNPYNEDIYEYIINNKLDETGIVYKIIDYFGISIKKNTEETLNKTYEETAKEMEDEKILDEEQSKVLLNLEKINETTVQSKCNYEELFEHVTAHFQEQGGILAVVDMIHGKVEALWKYGKDTSNIKITANFSAQKDESIQIRLEGSLENAIDNFNVAKKRAEEMTDEILKPINVKAWALTNNKYLIRHRGKRKNITALLTILGGFCGIHKFYIGNWGWGLVYLLLIGTGISLFLSVVEFIYILTLTSDKFNERYNYKKISVFTLV